MSGTGLGDLLISPFARFSTYSGFWEGPVCAERLLNIFPAISYEKTYSVDEETVEKDFTSCTMTFNRSKSIAHLLCTLIFFLVALRVAALIRSRAGEKKELSLFCFSPSSSLIILFPFHFLLVKVPAMKTKSIFIFSTKDICFFDFFSYGDSNY